MHTLALTLEKINWKMYGAPSLMKDLTHQEGEIVLFRLGRFVFNDELQEQFLSRKLTPADPCAIAAAIVRSPDLSEKYIGTIWKDSDKEDCFAAFGTWFGESYVEVRHSRAPGWGPSWWLAGVRITTSK